MITLRSFVGGRWRDADGGHGCEADHDTVPNPSIVAERETTTA